MDFLQIPHKEPFKLGRTVVTQKQWLDIMGTEPWRKTSNEEGQFVRLGNDYPAVCVSWTDAVEFCEKLSAMKSRVYRLPTEAEWEYACRGGTTTKFYFGDNIFDLGAYAWYLYNSAREGLHPHIVAQKKPNPFGLYDMIGNVWEWCENFFENEYNYVVRGGSWSEALDDYHGALRRRFSSEFTYVSIGFRVLMEI